MGEGAVKNPQHSKGSRYSDTSFGIRIYTTTRYFVVMIVRDNFCLCM
jgi:hypothetical protein